MSVTPLNPEIEEFKKLQELLGAHQTLPVLLATLEKGLKLKTDLKEISALLGHIFHSDDDKFWGNFGSIYFSSNRDALNLDAISRYKFEDNAYLEFFDFIAKIIENFDLNLVPTFSQYDFIKTGKVPILHSEENSLQDDNKAINSNLESPSKRQSSIEPELGEAIKNWVSAGIQHETLTRKQIKRNFGVTEMRILHFMTYLEDNNFYRVNQKALKNFDNYLSSFFDFSESSEKINFGEIEPHNAVEFLKIIASVTFSRLLKENSLLFKADTVKTFLTERLEKFNLENFKESPSLYAQYLVICNNIKIVSLLLDCDCIDSGILSEEEWQSPIFDLMDIPEEPAYLFLAPSFFPILIEKLQVEDPDNYFDPKIMTGISKGINRSSNYPERIKEGVEALFCDQKIDIAFKIKIGKVVYNNLLDWTLPLSMINKFSANCGFKDFLEDPINQETITDALKLSNEAINAKDCLFPVELLDLDGFAIPMEENFNWNNNTHPALHSTAFARNTVIFDPYKYILFGKSLIHHGQPFYACLITSIFFELRILFEFSYEKKEEQEKMKPLDGLLFSDWLTELQKFSSYNIVERSIKNYIEKGVYSSTNFGFLSAFLKNDDSTFAEVERENVIFLDTYSPKVDINETFKGLCPAALDALKKWMCFIDNDAFLRLGLGETLPIIAGNAVEAELKARTSEIDFNALKDIKIESGLKVPPEAKNTSKFQLGNFLHLLKNFSLLTPLSKSKMVGLNRIFKDKDYKEFIETVREISLARNNAGHVSDYTRADDVERTLSVIETLKPKFETCMDILNRTAF